MKLFIRLLAFIAISLAIIFSITLISLKRGIDISELSISNTRLNNIHLIWDNRLKLKIDKITVQQSSENSSNDTAENNELSYVSDVLYAVDLIEEWFSYIDINQVTAGLLNATFQYREDENGHLIISSPQIELETRIHTDEEFLLVDIEKLSSAEYKSHAQGKLRIDTDENKLTAAFEAMIADTLPLQLEIKADTKILSFSAKGKQAVANIAPVVEIFHLGPEITPWISEYLSASQISLISVSGSIAYEEPESILQTLHAVAKVKDTEYTFAQGLEPIKAETTDVIFEKGLLKIQPRNASFYGQHTGNSNLDINFNKEPFVLTAYIRTKAQASGGVLTLLNHYEIPFPFEQKEGLTDTNLTLAINLSTIDIDAKGTFKAENSVFEYDQQLFNVDKLDISLRDTNILLHQLNINMNKQISARVTGKIDAARSEGNLKISIDKFSYQAPQAAIELDNANKSPLLVNYHMRPDGDSVSAAKSSWKRDNTRINIGKFTMPIDRETWTGKLPPTHVALSPWLKTRVSGTFSRNLPYADLKIKLLDLKHDDIHLVQPDVEMELLIGENLILTTKKPTHILSDKTAIKLSPTTVIYTGDILHIQKSGLVIDRQLFSDVSGKIDFNTNTGQLQLDQLKITAKTGENLFAMNKPLPVNLSLQKNSTKVNAPILGIEFLQQHQQGWSLLVKDFAKLNKFSPLMQDYQLQKGQLKLSAQSDVLPWLIEGKTTYPWALLIDGDKPVHEYQLNGNYDGKTTSLNINEKVIVKLTDKVAISSDNIGYNLPALMDIINQQNNKPDEKINAKTNNTPLELKLNAKNSFIYLSDNKRILADSIQLSRSKGLVTGEVKHDEGYASMEINENVFSIVGKDFGKVFINELITLADFGQGEMDFTVSGELDDLDAVFRIQNAVIKDYKTLNNMLAFINTVPALITFRVPNYNRKGLPAKEIYVGANYKEGLINAKTIFIDSKELDLRGTGVANLNDDSVDMVFNLITGTKRSVQSIPLLGYVLAGDKKEPSITLTVKGDLYNPVIKHTTFKEVAAYPLNVLKNTVKLPGHLLNKLRKHSDTGDQKAGTAEQGGLH